MNSEKSKHSKMADDYNHLRQENNLLSEEMLEVEARSMRDHFMFYNITECVILEERMSEKYLKKFWKSKMSIQLSKLIVLTASEAMLVEKHAPLL